MKIRSLKLCKYRRMRLLGIDEFIFTPTSKIQLILGTNGSGKSSLIDELSPLPAITAHYRKGGYKIIEIEHNKNQYRLESHFDNGQAHYFYLNEENLNPGRTITVQKELVKQHFGYDNEIHELLTNQERFNSMNAVRRREWFTRLGEANHDYAISVYNAVKKRHNNIAGALDINKKRLATEISKIISEEEQLNLSVKIQALHDQITVLLENREVVKRSEYEIEEEYREKEAELKILSEKILKTNVQRPFGFQTFPYTHIETYISELVTEVIEIETKIRLLTEEFDKLNQLHLELLDTKDSELSRFSTDVSPIQEKIKELAASQTFGGIDNPKQLSDLIEGVEGAFLDVIGDLIPNPDNFFSQDTLDKLRVEKARIAELVFKLTNEIQSFNAERKHFEHLESGAKTSCPVCNHIWTPGYSKEKHQKIIAALEEKTTTLKELNDQTDKINSEIEKVLEYARTFNRLTQLMKSYPQLDDLWGSIRVSDGLKLNPRACIYTFNKFKQDVRTQIEINELIKRIDELDELMKNLANQKISNIAEAKDKLNSLSDIIGIETNKLWKIKRRRDEAIEYQKSCENMNIRKAEIEQLVKDIANIGLEMIVSTRVRIINSTIRELQSQLAIHENALRETQMQKGIIESLSAQIRDLEIDEKASKLLVASLSPKEGLIAEGLFGFIRAVTQQMNNLIKDIWTYPLEIIPCGMSDDGSIDLDYKFPIKVNEADDPVPDVSKGSTAMKEIIDLSFRFIAMKYSGLGECWLALDEFAAAMDHEHKKNSVGLIKTIAEQKSFSQLFMVSHDYAQYGGLSDKETCVLSADNVLLPEQYNKHVIMR